MVETLLRTKLYVPPLRPNIVPRPHLIERLNQGLQYGHKLTLVSAPAGFGKTTLVGEWVDNIRLDATKESQIVVSVAWLSLDESDNDPARFLTYFIAALNQAEGNQAAIGKGSLVMLQSPQSPSTEEILTSLINDITALPDRIVLVLDDFHLIKSPPVEDALAFLLEHLPPQMHLVIATRDDPHLPLSRLRARGQLTELRAADLRFAFSEAALFLNQVMGLDLSEDDINTLETRTEGWIAGLQLAALSMQGREDAASLIKSFAGSHRYVMNYLIEEVVERQPEYIQTFLLQTAILNRLTGSLCNALTAQDNGQATLEMLEHTNLFIIPLDDERRWYRYHHLFSDLLRQRLQQTQPEQLPVLHRKASKWYEQNGFSDEAIEHALRIKDFEHASYLLDEHVDAKWQRGEHTKLRSWLKELPVELVSSRPQLGIFRAYYLLAGGQLDAGADLLRDAEKVLEFSSNYDTETPALEGGRITEIERMKLLGRVAVMRALVSSDQGDVPGIIQHASKALDYLPQHDLTWRNLAAIALGDAYSYIGDMSASYTIRYETLEASKAAGDIFYIMLANLKLSATLRAQAKLRETIEICRQQRQLADEYGLSHTNTYGCSLAIWGETLAELNDLEGAKYRATNGFELALRGGNLAIIGYSSLCLIRVLFSRGELEGAKEIVRKIENVALEIDMPSWATNQIATWQTRIWLAQDSLDAASQWAVERGLDNGTEPKQQEMDFYVLFEYVMLARILIAESRLDEAALLLQRLLEFAEEKGRKTRLIEILMLQALALQERGEIDQAIIPLEQALSISEPRGFVRIFVDEGPPMARLLNKALSRGIAQDYIRQLLAAIPNVNRGSIGLSKARALKSELVEPLSEREIEVLQLIAEGLTNREIAARLFLAPNTVKVHTRNIYGKLGVNNRTQAAARARALGILPPT